ncbi:hypothetical protein E2P81_ATG00806 [Venturia nashicola]|uniref:MFS general substrate transporter n=1 Tax=Venturia nashicola TaxID=86259 RepID=A0A4Z1PKE6_9PEZI|nr:hypothetical protein E6O75_ATG00824 [Venturia nashicola]TLD38263.1 hypothetical protein E2P81_ATG00806 [Venturia nashicola]
MVSNPTIKPLHHANPTPQASATESNQPFISKAPPGRHATTSTFALSTSGQAVPRRTKLMSPESSLRSRLPWLDGKPPSKAPTPSVSSPLTRPGGPLATSESSSMSSSSSAIPKQAPKYLTRNISSHLAEPSSQPPETLAPNPSPESSGLHTQPPNRTGTSKIAASDISSLSSSPRRVPSRPEIGQVKTARPAQSLVPSPSSEYSNHQFQPPARSKTSRLAASTMSSHSSSPRRVTSRPEIRQAKTRGLEEVRQGEDPTRTKRYAPVTQLEMSPPKEERSKELEQREEWSPFNKQRATVSRRKNSAPVAQSQLSRPIEKRPRHRIEEHSSFDVVLPQTTGPMSSDRHRQNNIPRRKSYGNVTRLQMTPPVQQHAKELRPRRERSSFEPAFPQKMGFLDAIHPFKDPPSPMCGPVYATTTAALPPPPKQPMDDPITKPFNQALDRMEDLMRQAGDLIDEAAETAQPEEMWDASTLLRRASFAAGHPESQDSLRQSDQLPDLSESSYACTSSLSSDDMSLKIIGRDGPSSPVDTDRLHLVSGAQPQPTLSDASSDSSPKRGRTRHRSEPEVFVTPPIIAYPDSATRDFAFPTPEERDWKYCGDHVLGRRDSSKSVVADKGPAQDLHQPIPTRAEPYTAYIANSPLVSPGSQVPPLRRSTKNIAPNRKPPASLRDSTLRHRKTTAHENSPVEIRESGRHNGSDYGSVPGYYGEEPPTSDTTPVPWKDRISAQTLETARSRKAHKHDGDPEKGAGRSHQHRHHKWNLGHSDPEPIARHWKPFRKRFSATVACLNTALVGYILGVYAGMVPRMQYQLADQKHYVLLGNIYMYLGLSATTFFAWPLPLLHGRKPYILAALAIALPLQFPQAILVSKDREPSVLGYDLELIFCRLLNGFVLGLTNMNDFAVLLDLFGASLMSDNPHQEVVDEDDPRRDGGGIGLWLGIWTWCFIGSISLGFFCGAGIIFKVNPSWGFYVSVVLIGSILILNIIAPETRKSKFRHHWREYIDHEEIVRRRIARGEAKLHISNEGPKHCFDELWAGVIISKRMFCQRGFMVLSLYLGWIYGQSVLLIVLLGALLSRHYKLASEYVGLGVFGIAIGALFAVPLTKANILSRARKQGPRTDSMTFQRQITWTSHMTRRTVFMTLLPITGVIYTVVSPGIGIHFIVPILFAAAIGFFDVLAIAECYGLIMETWDVSDLQPGVNEKHRLKSMSETTRRRRTTYSCFPRVMSGIFVSQSIGFLLAAAATGIGGIMTRHLGAQISTGIAAGMLFLLTLLLTGAMWRFKSMQVVPNHALGTRVGTGEWDESQVDENWKAVIVGNPSGKIRRMSLLELGGYTRWTEIRRLNKLI